nr:MAG TPA: hypothetical protein [Caudoviricetes sp.]
MKQPAQTMANADTARPISRGKMVMTTLLITPTKKQSRMNYSD